jgi:hypothetical protein
MSDNKERERCREVVARGFADWRRPISMQDVADVLLRERDAARKDERERIEREIVARSVDSVGAPFATLDAADVLRIVRGET